MPAFLQEQKHRVQFFHLLQTIGRDVYFCGGQLRIIAELLRFFGSA
jgi:hypothetical protein